MRTSSPRRQTDEDALRQCLEPAAVKLHGWRSPTAGIERAAFHFSTSYRTQVVTVRLAAGDELTVFLKDFGSTVRPKESPKERREREIRVYQELLANADLGTPRYYGSILDDAQGRFWLLLEFVDGTPVGYCDIAGHWTPAVRGLGRLHGCFAEHGSRLRACDFLVHHSADFFWSKGERALRAVEQVAPHLADRLVGILRRYSSIVNRMACQPATLLQGGCRTSNVLVRVASDPARVCIIDWEEAAFGSPLHDLAYLLDGVEPPVLDSLLDAYCSEARTYPLSLPGRQDMKEIIDCCRLQMLMNMIGQAVVKRYEESDVAKLITLAEQLHRSLC